MGQVFPREAGVRGQAARKNWKFNLGLQNEKLRAQQTEVTAAPFLTPRSCHQSPERRKDSTSFGPMIRCAKLRGTPRASGKAKGAQHALRLNKPLKSFCTSGLTTAGYRSHYQFRILPFMEQNHHPLILSYQGKQQ